MPRVSDEHLAARRQQILDAARIEFTRNGFHATSMQDVIAAAGLSVGAVYRYFKSKEELIIAIAGETIGGVNNDLAVLAEHNPPLGLDRAMELVLDQFEPRVIGPDGVFRLAIQVWAESLRNPALTRFVQHNYATVRIQFSALVRRAQTNGTVPPEADPDGMGAALFSMMLGYLLQRALTDLPDRESFLAGVRALLTSPALQPASP